MRFVRFGGSGYVTDIFWMEAMRAKRIFVSCFILVIVVVGAYSFSGCTFEKSGCSGGEHEYGTEYFYDDVSHWIECKKCGSSTEKSPHTLDSEKLCEHCRLSFKPTSGVLYTTSPDGAYAEVIGYIGEDNRVVISDTYENLPVKKIDSGALSSQKMTSVVIPESVVEIGNFAFQSCAHLGSIVIPESVVRIGKFAFSSCVNLERITIPSGVTAIENSAFEWCISLVEITIPNAVVSIGKNAFAWCELLTEIDVPDNVETIGPYAFYNCTNLIDIKLGKGLEIIDKNAFAGCNSLRMVRLGESVSEIGDYAFSGCTNLCEMMLPASLKKIGYIAFYKCKYLEKVYYCGSEAEWARIAIDKSNSRLTDAERYYYSENMPNSSGKYWHYNSQGNIEIWN